MRERNCILFHFVQRQIWRRWLHRFSHHCMWIWMSGKYISIDTKRPLLIHFALAYLFSNIGNQQCVQIIKNRCSHFCSHIQIFLLESSRKKVSTLLHLTTDQSQRAIFPRIRQLDFNKCSMIKVRSIFLHLFSEKNMEQIIALKPIFDD